VYTCYKTLEKFRNNNREDRVYMRAFTRFSFHTRFFLVCTSRGSSGENLLDFLRFFDTKGRIRMEAFGSKSRVESGLGWREAGERSRLPLLEYRELRAGCIYIRIFSYIERLESRVVRDGQASAERTALRC